MSLITNSNKKQLLWLSLFLVFLAGFLYYDYLNKYNENSIIIEIRKEFEKKEQLAHTVLKQIALNLEIIFEKEGYFTKLSEEEGLAFFVFDNEKPFIWTSTIIHPERILEAIQKKENYIEENGTKAVLITQISNQNSIAIIMLSESHAIQNKYIKNKNYLTRLYKDNVEFKPYTSTLEGVYLQSKEPAFSFVLNSNTGALENNKSSLGVFFILLLLSWFLLVKESISAYKEKALFAWFLALLLSGLAWAAFVFQRTSILFQWEIFSPSTFAVFSWLSSLGEYVIWSIIGSFFVFTFPSSALKKGLAGISIATAFLSLHFLFSVLSIKWLVENSSISFNFNEISNINNYSVTALISLCMMFFSAWMLIQKILHSAAYKSYFLLIFSVFSAFIFWQNDFPILFILLFSLAFPLAISFLSFKKEKLSQKIISLLFVSLCLYACISYFSEQKELSAKQFLAQKIASDNDPLAELLFQEMKQNIIQDKELDKFINEDLSFNKNLLQAYLKDNYFSGYWEKYFFQVTPCFLNDSIFVQPENKAFSCKEFFSLKTTSIGKPVNANEDLFMLDYETGVGNYLAIVEKQFKDLNQKQHKYNLYIELTAKIIPEGSGYPELLLDNRYLKVSNNNNKFSYAKYKNGKMVLSLGNVKYHLQLPDWARQIDYEEVTLNGQNHFVTKPNDELVIIISSTNHGLIGKLTGFSYVFGILSVFYFLYNLFQIGIKQSLQNWKNLRTRIQILVSGTIALATIIFGVTTIYYQLRQFDRQNEKMISEKLRSILTEIEQKIGDKENLSTADEEMLSFYLIKFSNVFFTDLNIFDVDGELLASSRKNIFEMGLFSTKANTFAYNQINRLQNAQFIHREKIGLLSFFSAYAIIKNDAGKTLGYLNIPYFAQQDEMEKEISFFIGALINVYVVLFLLSVFVAIIISRLIAEPLQLIRSRLGNIALGKPNAPIEWNSKDEIGLLINEYNGMIHQLEESAEKLARSERESAWREMARQVAHEIKNPLTPMKLSVQHLQKTWKENPEEFEQRLKKVTQNLIEQIDTLSNIANEFSDFAKMPRPQIQELDIFSIAQQSIEFFKPTTKAHFILQKKSEHTRVLADKDQMIRVFNNLLKNAIQAIDVEEDGLIEVLISKENEMVQVSIRDNGKGIDDELKEKIFSPNFTTKTSGMGLGLAMIKNIINSHGGNIWFKSEALKGTTFFFTLPPVENAN